MNYYWKQGKWQHWQCENERQANVCVLMAVLATSILINESEKLSNDNLYVY